VCTVPEVTIEGSAPVEDRAEAPVSRPGKEELRETLPLLPFFIRDYHGGYGWRQYVRADQGVPEGAPRGLRELRALTAGAPLAVAQFSREQAPGTSIENLTLQSVEALGAAASAFSAAARLAPALERGTVTLSSEAISFGAKSANEAKKLESLNKTAGALAERGFDVVVRGEGVAAGELVASVPGSRKVLLESKRLTEATPRALQTAIEKGTKQSADVLIDGTGVGSTPEAFMAAFETFKRVSLARRIEQGAPITSGRIIFLFGQQGIKVVRY